MARLEDDARDSGEAEVRDSIDDATSSQSTSEALQEGCPLIAEVDTSAGRLENG